jgi:hypothetical protein
MKNSLRFVLPLIAIVFVVLLWRWTHPKLSDEQQIQAAISDIGAQTNHKRSGAVANYLSKSFQLDGVKRAEFKTANAGNASIRRHQPSHVGRASPDKW